jgi:hypothetical protein
MRQTTADAAYLPNIRTASVVPSQDVRESSHIISSKHGSLYVPMNGIAEKIYVP